MVYRISLLVRSSPASVRACAVIFTIIVYGSWGNVCRFCRKNNTRLAGAICASGRPIYTFGGPNGLFGGGVGLPGVGLSGWATGAGFIRIPTEEEWEGRPVREPGISYSKSSRSTT